MKVITVLLLAVAISLPAYPQAETNPANYETVLVPVVLFGEIQGALGSRWRTDLWVRNAADTRTLFTQGFPQCNVICDFPYPGIQPRTSLHLTDAFIFTQPTILYHVEKARAEEVFFSLRLLEVSGAVPRDVAELPVVREGEFFRQPVELLNLPTDGDHRVTLRVYDPKAASGTTVRVSVYSMHEEQVLGELIVVLFAQVLEDPGFPPFPGYAEIGPLTLAFPGIVGAGSVRVRIAPVSPGAVFWAFASVTHNASQSVSIVTP